MGPEAMGVNIRFQVEWWIAGDHVVRRLAGPHWPWRGGSSSARSAQPLHHEDMVDHAKLQAQLNTPICLDESIHSPEHARWALDIDACRVLNIKVGRVGGLSAARSIHDLCVARGVPVWCGGMLETNVGRAANIAIASLPNFTLPGDISASDRYYARDVAEPNFTRDPGSTIAVPREAGTSVTVVAERLGAARLRQLALPAGS